jgi:MFS family permease
MSDNTTNDPLLKIVDPAAILITPHDPYQALRFRDFRLLIIGQLVATLGEQMTSVAIGWELYQRTHSALALGLVGLVQIIPVILLSLPAGHIADQFNRKQIVVISQVVLMLSSLGLAILSFIQGDILLVYGCLLVIGITRAFKNPASSTLIPQTVPPEAFTNAATWNSSVWQLASVIGPALGGLMIALFSSATLVFVFDAIAGLIFALMVTIIRGKQKAVTRTSEKSTTLASIAAGISFIRRTRIILAAITLDMFAVLLGGATALLPIYADDILHVGPVGLGWLRAAPSIGALLMALVLAHRPPFKRAGVMLLLAVTGFGIATILFGLSRSFFLSLAMLGLLGAFDNISVVIRGTLTLVKTPDEMRGRVASVTGIFIGASNELGGFESGLAATLFGATASVVGGGIGTILVVLAIAYFMPEIRRLGALTEDD